TRDMSQKRRTGREGVKIKMGKDNGVLGKSVEAYRSETSGKTRLVSNSASVADFSGLPLDAEL
ncbi:hypothetical protein, partial [Pseudomonas sp.]|uniref:hypothetical protein n=1 Tax=Pseudomonas sp. TaxID=306 RepID=UPI003D6E14DE